MRLSVDSDQVVLLENAVESLEQDRPLDSMLPDYILRTAILTVAGGAGCIVNASLLVHAADRQTGCKRGRIMSSIGSRTTTQGCKELMSTRTASVQGKTACLLLQHSSDSRRAHTYLPYDEQCSSISSNIAAIVCNLDPCSSQGKQFKHSKHKFNSLTACCNGAI